MEFFAPPSSFMRWGSAIDILGFELFDGVASGFYYRDYPAAAFLYQTTTRVPMTIHVPVYLKTHRESLFAWGGLSCPKNR